MRKEANRVWRKHHGEKPYGYHLHHIDGNPDNNDISNLECLSPEDHAKKHGYISNLVMSETIRHLGDEWKRRHAEGIKRRSKNPQWRKSNAEACRQTAKNRTNDPWNKGKPGAQKVTDETRAKLSKLRTGRKWFNDGTKEYFRHSPEPHWNKGRL